MLQFEARGFHGCHAHHLLRARVRVLPCTEVNHLAEVCKKQSLWCPGGRAHSRQRAGLVLKASIEA